MKKSYRKSLTWLAFIVFGILVGWFAQSLISVFDNSSDLLPRNKYSLINPDLSGESIRRRYIPFELIIVKKIFENIKFPNPEFSL